MQLFFGGSFDPIHIGHLIVSRDVLEQLGVSKLTFIPAHQAPLKDKHKASPQDRFSMVKLAIEGCQAFSVSDLEIRRGGVSYTVDTARELFELYGERPCFLMGTDSALSLHMWKEPQQLIKLARFVIVDRAGRSKEVTAYFKEVFPELKEGIDYILLSVRRVDVSSTEIRDRLREGKSIKWLVPEPVEEYIRERGLYR